MRNNKFANMTEQERKKWAKNKSKEDFHELFIADNYVGKIETEFRKIDHSFIKKFSVALCGNVVGNSAVPKDYERLAFTILQTALEKTINNFFSEKSIKNAEREFDYKKYFDTLDEEEKKRYESFADLDLTGESE